MATRSKFFPVAKFLPVAIKSGGVHFYVNRTLVNMGTSNSWSEKDGVHSGKDFISGRVFHN